MAVERVRLGCPPPAGKRLKDTFDVPATVVEGEEHRQGAAVSCGDWSLCRPSGALAWGNNAQRLIVNHAVDTLPYELRPFFESNRSYLDSARQRPTEPAG